MTTIICTQHSGANLGVDGRSRVVLEVAAWFASAAEVLSGRGHDGGPRGRSRWRSTRPGCPVRGGDVSEMKLNKTARRGHLSGGRKYSYQ